MPSEVKHPATVDPRVDRARGAMVGLAVGDALGMPTQMLGRERIRELIGDLDGFVDAPVENEISSGTTAGHVTDDTDQAVIVGRLLVSGRGHVNLTQLADELLAWQERMVQIGSADLLGPSTRRALSAYGDGASPQETGRWGDTNGAAMRVTPIGIAVAADPLDRLVDVVAGTNRVTHDTGIANAGACAVAAVVSAAIDGADPVHATGCGIEAARLGAQRGHYVAGADVARRIEWARSLVASSADPLTDVYELIGTGVATQEAVPAAFALITLFPADPWQACLAAASLGGDSDTVAAMAGAMIGAAVGLSGFPSAAVEEVLATNPDLALVELADELLALRDGDRIDG